MPILTLTAAELADRLPQMVWIAGPDGSIQYCNQRWTDYTGLTIEQSEGWEWQQVLHPDDVARTLDGWRQAVQRDAPFETEYRFRRHDGRYRWFLARAEALHDDEGRVVRWFGTSTDIDDRKQLELHRRRLQLLLEASDDFIGFADLDGRPLYVNPAGLAMVGLHSQEEAQRYRMTDYLMPADREGVFDHIRATVAAKGRWEGDFQFRHFQTGELVPVHHKLYRIDDPTTRQPVGYATITTNLTGQYQFASALREREHDFAALADNLPQLAWMADPEGYIYWYNRRWYDYTGTTPEEMEGWGWQTVHDPQVLPRVLEKWRASIATGRIFDMTFPLRGADGIFRPFLTRVEPVRDTQGRLTRWFGTNTILEPSTLHLW